MRAQGAKITRKRQLAIAALIEQSTVQQAAKTAGIGQATLFRWLRDPAFQSAYRDAKRRVVDQAIGRLQRASSEAVDTLREVMLDAEKPPSARVACARAILDFAVKAVELDDLTTRMEILEQRVGE